MDSVTYLFHMQLGQLLSLKLFKNLLRLFLAPHCKAPKDPVSKAATTDKLEDLLYSGQCMVGAIL